MKVCTFLFSRFNGHLKYRQTNSIIAFLIVHYIVLYKLLVSRNFVLETSSFLFEKNKLGIYLSVFLRIICMIHRFVLSLRHHFEAMPRDVTVLKAIDAIAS